MGMVAGAGRGSTGPATAARWRVMRPPKRGAEGRRGSTRQTRAPDLSRLLPWRVSTPPREESRMSETLHVTWVDGDEWVCAWTCAPDGSTRRWMGFVRLDSTVLRDLVVHAQTEIRRYGVNSLILDVPAGVDVTAVSQPVRVPRGARDGAPRPTG